MLLGKFLEVSVYAPDIPASLEFYESLGFVQASTGETWSHPYAVITDGRLCIGLHQGQLRRRPSPGCCRTLRSTPRNSMNSASLSSSRVSTSEAFHEVGFLDPSGR
jgi:hypothetical protein